MKQRRTTMIALLSGVACAVCVGLFMWSVQEQADEAYVQMLARYGGEQVETCVATRDIAAGEHLDASSLETRLWVAGLLPEDAVCDGKDAIGQVATTSIMKGEVIVAKRFQKSATELDIPTGYQAVSVPVKAVQAVGGVVRAGMRVDVYSTGDTSTTALVTNALVLDTSVGDSESLTGSGNGWITLAIESKRVQEIVSAANRTSLYFTIPGETDPSSMHETSVSDQEQLVTNESIKKEGTHDASNSSLH